MAPLPGPGGVLIAPRQAPARRVRGSPGRSRPLGYPRAPGGRAHGRPARALRDALDIDATREHGANMTHTHPTRLHAS